MVILNPSMPTNIASKIWLGGGGSGLTVFDVQEADCKEVEAHMSSHVGVETDSIPNLALLCPCYVDGGRATSACLCRLHDFLIFLTGTGRINKFQQLLHDQDKIF